VVNRGASGRSSISIGGRPAGGPLSRAAQGRRARVGLCRGDDGGGSQRVLSRLRGGNRQCREGARLAGATRAGFDAQRGPEGALLIGDPEYVVDKIRHYDEALGGISRISLQMNVTSLPHAKLMRAIERLGTEVAPEVRKVAA